MKILPFNATLPKPEFIRSPHSFSVDVRSKYREFKENGFFRNTEGKSFYIYKISSEGHDHLGVVAMVPIKEYQDEKLKIHELTIASKEQRQIHLHLQRGSMIKPVLLIYPKIDSFDIYLKNFVQAKEPIFSITYDGDNSEHSLYRVDSKSQEEKIEEYFKKNIHSAYIADGHHRSAAISTLANQSVQLGNLKFDFSNMLCGFFSSTQLGVDAFNRTVSGHDQMSPDYFMASISRYVDITILKKPSLPKKKHEVVMAIQKNWYCLRWKKDFLDSLDHNGPILDVFLLDTYIIKEILGIDEWYDDRRIAFVGGPYGTDGVKKQMMKLNHSIAFCVRPIEIQDIFDTVDEGQTMHPKSTWFRPRLRNGIIVKDI